jgi:hypothetical protein
MSVPASTLQNVTDQIPTKVTEALTTYTAPTTTEMIALILTHVQAPSWAEVPSGLRIGHCKIIDDTVEADVTICK